MRNHWLACGAAAAASVLAFGQGESLAVLQPAAGPGTGTAQIAHELGGKGAPSAVPIFQVPADYVPTATIGGAGGGMQSPGGNFRTLGALTAQNDNPYGLVANVPVTQTTGPGVLGAGWNGGTTTVVGVAGNGRAGIAVTNSAVSNIGAGTMSANSVGASTDYLNVGAPILNVRYAHFISHLATVDGAGGFATAAVRSRIQIDPNGLVGPAFGTLGGVQTFQPSDLLMGFDGVGVGNADFLNGTDPGLNLFNAVGNQLTFAGIATTGLFNIPLGASVRISGALTLIGDPADIQMLELPLLMPPDAVLGMGGSEDADTVVPEPAGLALIGLAGLAIARRRKR